MTARDLEIIGAVVAAKHHLTNIFDELGVSNRLELALLAVHPRAAEVTRYAGQLCPPGLGCDGGFLGSRRII